MLMRWLIALMAALALGAVTVSLLTFLDDQDDDEAVFYMED